MIGHDKLMTLFKASGTIVAKGPLYVGSGNTAIRPAAVDMEFIKIQTVDGEEIPFIPGSSLKGVIRSSVERVVKAVNFYACDVAGNPCYKKNGKDISKELNVLLKEGKIEDARKLLDDTLCYVCKIFGNQIYSSHVKFMDAYGIKWEYGVRPGVAINREQGSVAFGPFFTEFVQPGSEFSFSMIAENLEPYQLGLIAVAISELNAGRVKLGGLKSRGMGDVEVIFDSIQYRTTDSKYQVSLPSPPPKKDYETLKDFTKKVLNALTKRWEEYVTKTQ